MTTATRPGRSTLANYRDPIILITFCILGAILGLVLGDKASFLKPIGQIFLNLLFCLIVPLIFFSIAGSIASTKDTGKVGKMIGYTLIIFILTATISGGLILLVTHFTGVPTSFTAPAAAAAQSAAKPVNRQYPYGRGPASPDFPVPRAASHHPNHFFRHLRIPDRRAGQTGGGLDECHEPGLL